MDYENYPSGESDTKQIECPECNGSGELIEVWYDERRLLQKRTIDCDKCKGTGYIEITLDEYEDQCRDREADLNHDDI